MSMTRVILLVVLPSLVSLQGPPDMGPPDMGPPDMTNCCQVKSNTAAKYLYYNFTPGIAEQYGCLDDCLYMKEGTMDKYCFGPGDLQINCEDEEPLAITGYLTVKEDGVEFKQKNEDMPDYLKISVPAHNNYPEAVVFYEKESSMRVSCMQGRDTAAEVEWVNTTAVMEYVKDNEGKIIDASEERIEYFVETVTTIEIPDEQRPVDIAPDRPIFASSIRAVSGQEFEEALENSMEQPVCIRVPNTHRITIRVEIE